MTTATAIQLVAALQPASEELYDNLPYTVKFDLGYVGAPHKGLDMSSQFFNGINPGNNWISASVYYKIRLIEDDLTSTDKTLVTMSSVKTILKQDLVNQQYTPLNVNFGLRSKVMKGSAPNYRKKVTVTTYDTLGDPTSASDTGHFGCEEVELRTESWYEVYFGYPTSIKGGGASNPYIWSGYSQRLKRKFMNLKPVPFP